MELVLPVVVMPPGDIDKACAAAVALAARTATCVRFDWNGIEVYARARDNPKALADLAGRVLERGGKLAFL